MQFYRCKCGSSRAFGSQSPAACHRCLECGSDLAQAPSLHGEPAPHAYYQELVDTDEGKKPLSRCRYCQRTRVEIERDENPAQNPK